MPVCSDCLPHVEACEEAVIRLSETVEHIRGQVRHKLRRDFTASSIVARAAALCSVKVRAVHTGSKTPSAVRARQLAAYVLRVVCGLSYPEVARELHMADHSWALYACRRVDVRRRCDERLRRHIDELVSLARCCPAKEARP